MISEHVTTNMLKSFLVAVEEVSVLKGLDPKTAVNYLITEINGIKGDNNNWQSMVVDSQGDN